MNDDPKNSTALTTLSDEMLALTEPLAGLGISDKAEDRLIPLITVLQSMHTQCSKHSPDFVPGAEPGKIWFRDDMVPIRDSFEAIPVHMLTIYLEWGPTRGSGLFGRHLTLPDDAVSQASADGKGRPLMVRRGSGNVLQHVREFFVLVDGVARILPFHGDGHTTARRLQHYFTQLRHPRTNRILPSFSHRYRFDTFLKHGQLGDWFALRFTDLGPVSVPEFKAALALYEVIERGSYRVDMTADTNQTDTDQVPF
jgi:hypothetical protein